MNQETKELMLSHFEPELARIENPDILALVANALATAPTYFWEVPASSSGKYHPDSSLGFMGLIRHVKSVFRISEEILDNNTYTDYYADWTKDDLDLIRGAILLHDSAKQGKASKGSVPGSTVHDHPVLVRTTCVPDNEFMGSHPSNEQWWDIMCTMLESHMGEWNKRSNHSVVLPLPQTRAQKHIHLCDYLASRKSIGVNVYAPMSPKRAHPPATITVNDPELKKLLALINKSSAKHYNDLINSDKYRDLFKADVSETDRNVALEDMLYETLEVISKEKKK